MSKLVFYYGVMGCSKTANALMTRFQYIERGKKVLFIKPAIDTRDNTDNTILIKSRIGIQAEAIAVPADAIIFEYIIQDHYDVIICDEAQFLTSLQVEQLRSISTSIDVICYGLRTDFQTQLFPGSKRLLELADEIREIESVCKCGNKAIINARFNSDKKIVYDGNQVELGGNDKYIGVCWNCYNKGEI